MMKQIVSLFCIYTVSRSEDQGHYNSTQFKWNIFAIASNVTYPRGVLS